MVSRVKPNIFRKSLRIHPRSFQGPSVCICVTLDCKMVPKDFQMVPKFASRNPKNTENQHNTIIQHITNIFVFVHCIIYVNPGNQFFYSCQSFETANQRSAGCQRGRWQGRSLRIYIYIFIYIYIYIYLAGFHMCGSATRRLVLALF